MKTRASMYATVSTVSGLALSLNAAAASNVTFVIANTII